ncbi:MAG TPA: peptidoglycan bridge formation glycyltransferase FemA/FemB family protein [Clostridiaceae bacterium]|nr:peptidoglycan bridge formation glycyltransferase FemA/FemB family protein [Clostridiaceae bacterium]
MSGSNINSDTNNNINNNTSNNTSNNINNSNTSSDASNPSINKSNTSSNKSNNTNNNKSFIYEYEEFVKSHPKGHFMQSIKWAKVKSNWINEIITVRDENNRIKGSMSLLIRKVPFLNRTIMYSPRGPVCDIYDVETFKSLIEKAKELAVKYKSYVLKLDPDIEIQDTEFCKIVKQLGFKTKNDSENFESIQPRFVFRLDIKGKTEEEVLKNFSQKTRYNIRLAIKRGVTVRIGSKEDIPEFHKIMYETGVRDKFVIRDTSYFETLLDALGENARLYLAYYNGKLIAGTIAILYGNKCWYLYGASSNEHRNVMPNYLLQWEMIKWAIESGCDIYDFRGVSGNLDESHPLYGLYRFKKGFRGKFTEFIGELDYVFNPITYKLVEKSEIAFRELRRQLFVLKAKIAKEK